MKKNIVTQDKGKQCICDFKSVLFFTIILSKMKTISLKVIDNCQSMCSLEIQTGHRPSCCKMTKYTAKAIEGGVECYVPNRIRDPVLPL